MASFSRTKWSPPSGWILMKKRRRDTLSLRRPKDAGTGARCHAGAPVRQERAATNEHAQTPCQPPQPSPGSCSAAARAKTTKFLSSIRLALQAPLIGATSQIGPPATNTANPVSAPRRSGRLANQALNALVRPSKKGEVLAMRKLGIIAPDEELHHQAAKEFDRFIAAAMLPQHFAALRDIFPAARLLSDDELRTAAQQAASTIAA